MRCVLVARGLTGGGVARYLKTLVAQFHDRAMGGHILVMTDDAGLAETYPDITELLPAAHRLWWDNRTLYRALRRYRPDVVIYPKNVIPPVHVAAPWKKVIIVNDLAHFEKGLNEYRFADSWYMRMMIPPSCRIADRILVISESTGSDLCRRFGVEQRKVFTMPLAVDTGLFTSDVDPGLVDRFTSKPYFFYCGALSPRKNILRSIRAFLSVADQIEQDFVLVSGASWHDAEVRSLIAEHRGGRIHLHPYVSEKELVALYQNADALIYPSLYEGFGLPILEAQASGCPVLTSSVTSCPEVAGQGAIIVDPRSVAEIAEGMLQLGRDGELREALRRRGRENLRRYSWDKTADALLFAVESV